MGDILLILFLMLVVWCFGYSVRINKKGLRIGWLYFWVITIPSLLAYLVCIVLLVLNMDIYLTILRHVLSIDISSFVLFMMIQVITEIIGSLFRFIFRR